MFYYGIYSYENININEDSYLIGFLSGPESKASGFLFPKNKTCQKIHAKANLFKHFI